METHKIIEISAKEKSLSNLVDGFLLERKSRGLQVLSIESYRGHLKHFTMWAGRQGIKSIDDITPTILRAFLLYLEETKHKRGVITGNKDSSLRTCAQCGKQFAGALHGRYCGSGCKSKAYRERKARKFVSV